MARISIDSLIGQDGPNYPEQIAAPYRAELVGAGFEQMLTPEDVDRMLDRNDNKMVLVVLNSVCGCAARVARPGAILSLFNNRVPDLLVTLFAGMEKEAVTHFREKYLKGMTPSSPCIALFRNGQLAHILHRYQIESRSAAEIAENLAGAYDSLCTVSPSAQQIESLRRLFQEKYRVDPLNLPTE